MNRFILLFALLSTCIHGCEIEFDYEYDTLPPFFSDCSSCPPFTSLFYSHFMNATDTDKYSEISECVYNYTCTTVQLNENYVIVNATDELKVDTGFYLRVQLTDKPYPAFGDPINVFDALGFKCIDSTWYATKFPFGLYHSAGNKTISAEGMVGIKLPIQSMSILWLV